MKSFSFRVGATLVASLSLAACGGPLPVEQGQPQQTPAQRLAARRSLPNRLQPGVRPTAAQPEVVAELVGHYSHATGRLTFTRRGAPGAAGLPRPGFSPISTNNVSLDDNHTEVAGPATVGGNGCASGQICAMVTLTNDSARQIENPHVEIIEMTGGATLANPESLPSGYPTSATGVGGWNYATVAAGNPSAPEFWAFNMSGGADFSFNVKVWGTYTRSAYVVERNSISSAANVVAADAAWNDSSPPWRDACLFGSTLTSYDSGSPLSNVSAFDFGVVEFPFPFTLYRSTFSPAPLLYWIVNTNGMMSFTAGYLPEVHSPIASAPGLSVVPFWDEGMSIANGQICAGVDTTSATPQRRFVVTWKNAQLNVAGSPSNRLSFSVVFQESTDNVFFLYHRWTTNGAGCALSGADAPRMRGNASTIGIAGDFGDDSEEVGFNQTVLPTRSPLGGCPGLGYFVKLTATPTNP